MCVCVCVSVRVCPGRRGGWVAQLDTVEFDGGHALPVEHPMPDKSFLSEAKNSVCQAVLIYSARCLLSCCVVWMLAMGSLLRKIIVQGTKNQEKGKLK